jgi:hypothetical protein
VNVRLLIVIDDELPFVSVTAFAPPVLPIATEYQLRLVGETVTAARQLAPCRASSANGTASIDRSNRTLASGLLRNRDQRAIVKPERKRAELDEDGWAADVVCMDLPRSYKTRIQSK